MENRKNLNQECDYFSASIIDDIVWFELKGNILLQSTNLQCRDELIDYLDLVSEDTAVKIVAFFNSNESTGYEKYAEFYQMLGDHKISKNDVWRTFRTFDTLIKKILESPKFFITAAQGKLYPQILSVSLACDYRIVAENTIIQNGYLDFGLAPKGGEVYFLKKRLGHCKAFELLLSEKEITAHDALRLGAVNKVVPVPYLQKSTLNIAQEFAKKSSSSLSLIKRLLNYSEQNLADYLEFENQELMHTLGFSTDYGRFGWRRQDDSNGVPIKNLIKETMRLDPLASMSLYPSSTCDEDKEGASLILKLRSENSVCEPIVESFMFGSCGTHAVAFTTRGQAIEDVSK